MQSILITTGIFHPDIGGPASYGMALARKLSDRFKVTVVAYSSHTSYPEDKNLPFKLVRVWRKIPKGLRHLVFLFRVYNQAKNSDIIFSLNAVTAGIPAWLTARWLKKKFFVKIVGDYAWERAINKGKTSLLINDFQKMPRKGWTGWLHRFQVKVCQGADGIIVPSEYLSKIVKGWGISAGKIKVIYNEVEFRKSELSKEEARNKIGIHGNIIVSVGRLVPWKGFRMLIKIMPALLKINQFFRLVIVGEGPEKPTLESMVKNMNLDRKVYLVGKRSQQELAVYLAASDMFVLNTGYEGFSHQILEVMMVGVPVITTAIGGNKEIIHQGENGFMIRYNDEFNLVEAIKALHQSSELRDKFIEGGKKTTGLFNLNSMYEETVKFLSS